MSIFGKLTAKISWKNIAIAVVALVAMILLLKLNISFWLNRFTPNIEQAVTEATGYRARIEDGISVMFFPAPAISIRGIALDSKESRATLTAKALDLNFELLPLLDREFRIYSVILDDLHLRLPVNEKGVPVIPAVKSVPAKKQETGFSLNLESFGQFELRRGNVAMVTSSGETLHYLKDADLILHPTNLASVIKRGDAAELSLSAFLEFKQAKLKQLEIGQTRLKASYQPDQVSVDILKSALLDGAAKGKIIWRPKTDSPSINVIFSLLGYDTGKSSALFQRNPLASGKLNLETNIAGNILNTATFLRTAVGSVDLSGADVDLLSINLDQILEKAIKSQNYNLVDATAYFFIGPMGMQATKGLDVASMLRTVAQSGAASTRILRIKSEWVTADGVATAKDVALETKRYRLALKGQINLVKSEFNGIKIAVVDDRGCAIVKQRIDGPMKSPRVGKVNLLLVLTQPVLDALGKSAKRLVGGSCEPFYTGALLPEKRAPLAASTGEPAATNGD